MRIRFVQAFSRGEIALSMLLGFQIWKFISLEQQAKEKDINNRGKRARETEKRRRRETVENMQIAVGS